jgi:hypothetical protein
VTNDELIAKWESVLSGAACGCPLCTRDLLDDIATRFREVIGAPMEKGAPTR